MARPTVAVIVVLFNSGPVLADFAASLPAGLAGLDWHLTLVDNASTDNSVPLAHKLFPDSTVLETGRNGGYAAGINAGLARLGRHDAVLVLNPDVRLQPGCVAILADALKHPGVGVAAPRQVNAHGRLEYSMRREPTIRRMVADATLGAVRAGRIGMLGEVVSDPSQYAIEQEVDWASGAILLISRECAEAVGPWDESYFLYSEETDFALRARDAGFATRFVPSASAVHLKGGSAVTPSLWSLLTKNRVRLYSRRHGRARAALFYSATTIREASRAGLGHATSRAALATLLSPRRMREEAGPWSISQTG